ncbi:MAG: competence/damage-inducible protein A [Prevotellaceae bacterium]|jgi:nicotinamide-nucleotide amidase|nr:competence/damage-inducible protein A [Prevotellaceae bacterium]
MFTAEIITIGDEILIGQIVDTNSAWMAAQLNMAGVKINRITSISDKEKDITKALQSAEKYSDMVLITGGLGPTNDDITKQTLAKYFNSRKMLVHQPSMDFIEARFAMRGLAVSELNRQQAEIPDNCTVIPNRHGTAPGMWFEKNHTIVVAMPGVPDEMKKMLPDVINRLKQRVSLPDIVHKTMLTYGISESALAEKIDAWEQALPNEISLAYLPNIETGVKLRLSTAIHNGNEIIAQLFENLANILGNSVYGYEPDTLESVVGKLLRRRKASIATAESCTGGKIAHRITSISGSSEYFRGSVVAYSNEVKTNILGVNPSDIEKYGAVSSKIALQMAKGVRKALNADFAVSTTGIAGPAGGSSDKPVGMCWFGVSTPQETITFAKQFGMDREGNIASAAAVALNAIRLQLTEF